MSYIYKLFIKIYLYDPTLVFVFYIIYALIDIDHECFTFRGAERLQVRIPHAENDYYCVFDCTR
jgi:hypothetical protein